MLQPPPTRPLVSTEWLAHHVAHPAVRVVDVRWHLHGPRSGRDDFRAGHIPGAVFLDVDTDLSDGPARVDVGGAGPGRHPLPSPEAFAETLARAGIGDETLVVAYDDASGAYAARLWFLLRYFGHETGLVLDGGFAAWTAEGRPITTEASAFPRGAFHARPRPELVVDSAAVDRLRRLGDVLVLDARAPERFRGESEPIDAAPGHVPGAKNAPFTGNLGPDRRWLDRASLADRFGNLGADHAREIVAYCGSGVTACHDLLALDLAGITPPDGARLYEGSWSDWSRLGLPIATGDE